MARNNETPRREKADRDNKREKAHSELNEKVLHVNRCSKVVSGGRKFSFSAIILVGDGKGRVGYGFAKANELTDAIRKGGEAARKNMIECPLEGTTIPHELTVHWDGATIFFKPAPRGTGVIAGSMPRAILEMAGYKDVMAKNMRSRNPINQVKATFEALRRFIPRSKLRSRRGIEESQ